MSDFNKEMAINSARELFKLLDVYLIKDLETMIEEIPPRKEGGGLGYPAIHSLIAGMELLGLCTSGGKKEKKAFIYFWLNYLRKNFPEYDSLEDIFYTGIRHGTAHLFLVRSGISISKSNSYHLEFSENEGHAEIRIDLVRLFRHFLVCYEIIKKELLITQDEETLKKFWKGFEELFGQMERTKKLVEKFYKENGKLKISSSSSTSSAIVSRAQSSTISYRQSDMSPTQSDSSEISGTIIKTFKLGE